MTSDETYDKLREEILRETERAFADIEYPGDDSLVSSLKYPESQEMAYEFKGRHWREIPQRLAYKYRLNLPRFTPEAFRFYFPAFLFASLRDPIDANFSGDIEEYLLSHLVPPEQGDSQTENFFATVKGFNSDQAAVVRAFVKLFIETNPHHAKMYGERVKEFWKISE